LALSADCITLDTDALRLRVSNSEPSLILLTPRRLLLLLPLLPMLLLLQPGTS
jgi:hypothetical protein